VQSALNAKAIVCVYRVRGVLHQDRRPRNQINRLLHANRKASAWPCNGPLTRQGNPVFGDEIGNELGIGEKDAAVEVKGPWPSEFCRLVWLQRKAYRATTRSTWARKARIDGG